MEYNMATTIELDEVRQPEMKQGMEYDQDQRVSVAADPQELVVFDELFNGLGGLQNSKVVTTRWRFIIMTILLGTAAALDFYYISSVALSITLCIIVSSIFVLAVVIDCINCGVADGELRQFGCFKYIRQRNKSGLWKMTHLETKLTANKTYGNALCYLTDVRNNFGIFNAELVLYLEFIMYILLFIGSVLIHSRESKPIYLVCLPEDQNNEDALSNGDCFFTYEWTLCGNFVAFGTIMVCIMGSFDVDNNCLTKIKEAQQKLKQVLKHDYYTKSILHNNNKDSKWFLIIVIIYGLIFSFHLLWFPNKHTKAFSGKNGDIVKILYGICVFVFFTSITMLIFLFRNFSEPYSDFYQKIKILTKAQNTIDQHDLNKKVNYWWLIRQFYYNYVMVVYYSLTNLIYGINLFLTVCVTAIIVWWAIRATILDQDNLRTFLTYSSVCTIQIGIILCVFVLLSTIKIASVHPERKNHIKLLKYKLASRQLSNILQQNKEDDQNLINSIASLADFIENYDVVPGVFGITITWEKFYIFVGYLLSAVVTTIGVLQGSSDDE